MPCRMVPLACESSEPTPTMAAVLRFVSDQIKLANSIATSSTSLGLRFHELLEEDQANLEALQWASLLTEQSHMLFGRGLSGVNVTELLHTPLIDLTPRGFIGGTFTYALDELEHLCSLSCPDYSHTRGENHDARALAVYHRISSALLLEYSAAQLDVVRLLDALQTTRRRFFSMVAQLDNGPQVYETRHFWRCRKDYTYVTQQEAFSRLLARLDATIESLSLLVVHLDHITQELSSVPEKPVSDRKIELTACLNVLRNLFARSILPPGHRSSALPRSVHDISSLVIRRIRTTFSLIHVVGVT
ncbi:hypothetical protein EDD16DRAFT_245048 [Pisolithus croceorrhizus]|nr:hypothetical protein EDD16DRAFT_245048 [Pisolithus croceorrhizus]